MKDTTFVSPDIQHGEDLTEKLFHLTRELEESNRRLSESEAARMRILQNISHDLRAPLAAVRGAVDRMSSDTLAVGEQEKLIQLMDRRVTTLEKLVEELYLSQKLVQPEFVPNFETLSFCMFIEEYCIQLEVSGRMEQRVFTFELPKEGSGDVVLDTHLFVRVLDNITANALCHTNEGDAITFEVEQAQDKHITLHIYNSGAPIQEEHLPYIFERTFTTSSARTPAKSGSGLGLYIARTIVEKHAGTLSCHNDAVRGVCFSVTLPLA